MRRFSLSSTEIPITECQGFWVPFGKSYSSLRASHSTSISGTRTSRKYFHSTLITSPKEVIGRTAWALDSSAQQCSKGTTSSTLHGQNSWRQSKTNALVCTKTTTSTHHIYATSRL